MYWKEGDVLMTNISVPTIAKETNAGGRSKALELENEVKVVIVRLIQLSLILLIVWMIWP